MAYGAALGGWAYIIAKASLFLLASNADYRIATAIAAIVGIFCTWQYQRLSGMGRPSANEELRKKVDRHKEGKSPVK
ncbi:MAG: hypothetical protein ACE5Q6_11795 [Dehalococcoidia bacterium]